MRKSEINGPNRFEIDDQGIPYVNYGTINGNVIGRQRNPVTISQKAMTYYEDYIRNDDDASKHYLINNADWLIDNAKNHKNFSILEYSFPWPIYNLPTSWRSGMAQGEAIHALTKAHRITNDQKYLEGAKLLLNSFFVEVASGGVTLKSSNHEWWYEEYAHEKARVSRVLNGMMISVLDIYAHFKYTNDEDSKLLFDNGVTGLVRNLHVYNFNGYSYYDVLKRPAGEKYHGIHVSLAKQLFDITNQKVFKEYHEKWKSYKPSTQSHISKLTKRAVKRILGGI
jgi:heparosan-N-sulfate-glucuronate 5-epimerase